VASIIRRGKGKKKVGRKGGKQEKKKGKIEVALVCEHTLPLYSVMQMYV